MDYVIQEKARGGGLAHGRKSHLNVREDVRLLFNRFYFQANQSAPSNVNWPCPPRP